ncbi:prealbumin-like fold domain-containing protein [Agromyces silvae]|uniref:prealbumin-like fold domain-containing protein n=1 Tax=Agromyces silvae TaxID=3388266 RepID=UPI00280BAE66|nr:LPXTG cell wall anchor domain-containing protein [Agromyces protaetiae]
MLRIGRLGSTLAALTIGALLTVGVPSVAVAAPVDPSTPPTTSSPETTAPEAPESETPATETPAPEAPAPDAPAPEAPAAEEPATDAPANPDSTGPPAGLMTPFSVNGAGQTVAKTPTSTTTIIKVAKRDVRTASGASAVAYTYAEGARFQLLRNTSGGTGGSPGAVINEPWAQCTIVAGDDGFCYFSVPGTNSSGANRNERLWVQEIAPAPGTPAAQNYDIVTTFRTGGAGNSGTERAYAYLTPQLQANNTVNMPTDEVADSSAYTTSGMWANKLKNPELPQQCTAGVRVALLFDLSGSVKNAGAAGTLGQAGKGFVDALAGTSSSVALYSFGDLSPRATTSNYGTALAIDSGNNQNTLKSRIDGYIASFTAPGYDSNGTNWDRGLWAVAQNASQYDLVVVLTDGNPTFSGTGPTGPGSSTYFRELEQAVFSANAIKNQSKRVITVGIGSGLAPSNLSAISGPRGYQTGDTLNDADYFNTDWEDLEPLLADFAKSVTCNVPVTVKKVEKALNGSTSAGANWTFTPATPSAGTLTPGAQSTNAQGVANWNLQFSDRAQSTNLSFTETAKPGWSLESVVCTSNGANVPASVQGTTFQIPGVEPGDKLECTVTNVQAPSTVELNKQWVVNGVASPLNQFPAGFQAAPTATPAGSTAIAWDTVVGGYAQGQKVTLGEKNVTVPALCTLTGATFSKVAGGDITAAGVVNALAGGANEYTVTNTVTCDASLTLVKKVENAHGGTAVASDWNGNLRANQTAFNTGETKRVAPGTYALSETQREGYELVGVQCVGATYNGDTGSVTLTGQQAATCTFTNRDLAPTLTLVKTVSGSAVPASNWTLTATGDKGSVVTGPGGAGPVNVLAGETFSLTEVAAQYGDEFTNGSWSCDSNVLVQGSNGSAVTLTPIKLGQHVTCSITNTAKPAQVTHTKAVTSAEAQADGTWNVTYDVKVTNASRAIAGAYSLTDAFRFGPDVVITDGSAVATNDAGLDTTSWNGVSATTLAPSGTAIAANTTHTFTITVNTSLKPGAGEASLECGEPGSSTAFSNVATLNGTTDRTACAEPALPTVTKTAVGSTPVDGQPGQWDAAYTIAVTNGTSTPVYFDLTDTPAVPAGVTVVGEPTITPVAPAPANLTGVALPANTTFSYQVVVRVQVTAEADGEALECTTEDGGIRNVGRIVSSGQERTDDACVTIELPVLSHEKTVSSASQQADGRWTIVYGIEVTNDGDVPGVYTLRDATAFGAGITYDAADATVTGPGARAEWNGDADTLVAADQPLAADESAVYEVTVRNVTVAEGVVGSTPAGACPADGSTADGAFNNVATLISGGTEADDAACAAPTRPAIAKDFVSSAQDATDGTWDVTYTITVDNTSAGARDAYYALSDETAFAADAEVLGWTVSLDGATVVTGPFGDGVIVPADAQRAIAAGATDVYTVVFEVRVPAGVADAACTGEPGNGFFNTAVLTAGNDRVTDDACGPITDGGVPSVAKTVTSTTQQPDGSWAIEYRVVVTGNADYTTKYSLTDTLDFGGPITVVSAEWSGETSGEFDLGSGTAEFATDRTIGATKTHEYVVSVVATVAAGAFQDDPSELVCAADQPEGEGTGFLNRAVLSSGKAADQHVDACSQPATPEISKTVTSSPTQDGDDWTIEYRVRVTNTSAGQALVYSLEDTLDFGNGVTIEQATATRGGTTIAGWNGQGETTLATDRTLAGGATEDYVITVRFSVADTDDVSEFTCTGEPGNGLFNGASVSSGADDYEAEACAEVPVSVTVDKVWVLNGIEYPVAEAPEFLQDAATLTLDGDVKVWGTTYAPYAAGDELTIGEDVIEQLPSGCVLGEPTGLGTVTLDASVNEFTVVNPVDCEANLSIDKRVVSTAQLADGTWDLVYEVSVANDSPVIEIEYDLDDTLEYFGEGIDVNEASWSGEGRSGEFSGDTATLATDEVIEGGSEPHVYTVTVNATVTGAAWTDETTQCEPGGDGYVSGGFRNVATATVDGEEPISATACDVPGMPDIVKTVVGSPELQADGTWQVQYRLTVENGSAHDLYYDLADTLEYPAGVEVVSSSATTDAPDVDPSSWTGLGEDTVLADDVQLPIETTHTYTVTVIAAVSQETATGDLVCDPEGGPGGFLNGGLLTSGTVDTEVEACAEIPMGRLTLIKHVDNTPFDGLDLEGKTLGTAPDWTLAATGEGDEFVTPGAEDGTTRLVPAGQYTLAESLTEPVENPLLTFYAAGEWTCDAGTDPVTAATVVAGGEVTCRITNTAQPVDLAIEKLDGGEFEGGPAVPTDEDAEYDYTFTVRNNSAEGTPAATGVVVTDELPETIAVVTLPELEGWTVSLTGESEAGFGGTLTFTKDGAFAVGEEAVFTLRVKTAADLPRAGGDPTAKILDIENTATVTSDGVESTPEDNTSTEITPVKSIQIALQPMCRANAPYIDWNVTPYNIDGVETPTIVLIWWTKAAYAARDASIPASDRAAILADGAARVDSIVPPGTAVGGEALTGSALWPGAVVDDAGNGIAWPGWLQLPTGQWILTPQAPFYDLRGDAVLEVRMNPTTDSIEAYPPATIGCNPAPSGKLPSTGFDGGWFAFMGGGLVFAGLMFLLALHLRRRRNSAAS